MHSAAKLEGQSTRQGALLLIAAACTFIVALVLMSGADALGNLYKFDAVSRQYAAIAEHAVVYRWTNIVLAIAAAFAAVGTMRLAKLCPSGRLSKAALAGFIAAMIAWVVESGLRATLVVARAVDIQTGDAMRGTTLTDRVIEVDIVFAMFTILGAISLVTLAVMWARAGLLGRPAAAMLVIGGVANAAFVMSDPLAINYLPPFAFIAFIPVGIALLWRTRVGRSATVQNLEEAT